LDHLLFKFVTTLSEVSLTVISRTKRDDVCHPIRTFVCQSDYMVALYVASAVRAEET
jgi:hypothetical protein